MAGQFQNNLALESMAIWAKSINSLGGKWEGNDIHIDEVKGFESIQREDWIKASFEVLELLTPQILMVEGKFFFLYIPLQEARNKIEIEKLNRKWLNEHLDDFTPPSFHYTSIDYFNEYYLKELTQCTPCDDLIGSGGHFRSLKFYYRNYLDKNFSMYHPIIYVFLT